MKISCIVVLLNLFLASVSLAQTPSPSPTPAKDPEKEKAQIVSFLRDIDQDVSNLRLPENRIAFFAEVASLMWQFDETQARNIYAKALADLRQQIVSSMAAVTAEKAAAAADPDALTASFVGAGGMFGRSSSEADLNAAISARQQLLLAIAENDPELAMNALADTAALLTDRGDASEAQDAVLLQGIAMRAAEKDPKQALSLALESVKKGVTMGQFQVVSELYRKDPEAARTLAQAIMSKLKTQKNRAWELSGFISSAERVVELAKKTPDKTAPFSTDDLRDIAGLLADKIGENADDTYIDIVEKYLPARAAALRAGKKRVIGNSQGRVTASGFGRGSGSVNSMSNSAFDQEKFKKRNEDQRKLNDLAKLSTGQLPKEEREKILTEARKTIARIRDPRDKIIALSAIATGVVSTDKPFALELMREADQLAPTTLRSYSDFMVALALASGYAMVDPEQAFPRIELLIGSTNEVLNAGVRMVEFIDPNGTMIEDNEIRIGAIAGPSGSGVIRALSIVDVPLQKLAEFDLARTSALADRFDRPEARVLAKMIILRAYSKKLNAKADEVDEEITTQDSVID